MLRVVSGSLKNKLIPIIKNAEFRPSTNKTRQAIFSIIHSMGIALKEANVLDIFCGSGSLGIEAISRGAKFASFVDINPTQLALLKKFLAELKLPAEVLNQDGRNKIYADKKYDIVFMDAPYYQDLNFDTLVNLDKSKVLAENCLLIIETAYNEELKIPDSYLKIDERRYSKNKITFLRRALQDNYF